MDTDDTNDASEAAAPPSPVLPPDEDATTGSMVASPAVSGAGPLSSVLQDLHERAAGYATRGSTGP